MAGISFYNYNSVSTMFSLMNNNRNTSNYMFSGINIADYSSIKSGAYGKLLKAYYAKDNSNEFVSSKKNKLEISSDKDIASNKINAASVKNTSSELVDSSSELRKTALWEKKTVTAEDGTKTQEYDKEAIYKAVSEFVSDYNSLIKATGDSEDNSVLRKATSMVNYTQANKSGLSRVGVTINSDNTLSVNKEKFEKASMASVKSMFTGSGSYGQTVSSNASMIYSSAVSQLAKLESGTLYSSNGGYNYAPGYTYNRYL